MRNFDEYPDVGVAFSYIKVYPKVGFAFGAASVFM